MDEFNHIIPEYVMEASQLLRSIETGLLQLEDREAAGDTLSSVFQDIHKIKAGAGFSGLDKIQRLAGKMEGVLDLCRNGDLEPSQPLVDSLLQSLDVLASLVDRIDEHGSIDIQEPIRALKAVLDAELNQALLLSLRPVRFNALPNGIPDFEISAYALKNKLDHGDIFFMNLEQSQIEANGLSRIQLINELLSMGEILGSRLIPPADGSEMDQDAPAWFDVLFATTLTMDQLLGTLPIDQGKCHPLQENDLGHHSEPEAGVPVGIEPEPFIEHEPLSEQDQEFSPAPDDPPTPTPVMARQSSHAPLALAEELAMDETDDEGKEEYLTFTLGDENYGVDILSVQEIITLPRLTMLPRSPEYVLGVMNLRGMVVPVMDMRIRLNLPIEGEMEPVVVVLNIGTRFMGAVVDTVSDVVELRESEIQEPPEFAGAVHKEFLRGLCRHDDELIILLDLDRINWLEAQDGAP
jgi:chemotaxis signal transduction protein/HPt (histidine-containing phosphotransfer) domain-containing protein